MWEDKSAQLCNAAKNLSLFPSTFSPCRRLCVHPCVHTCTPTPIACLHLEACFLFKGAYNTPFSRFFSHSQACYSVPSVPTIHVLNVCVATHKHTNATPSLFHCLHVRVSIKLQAVLQKRLEFCCNEA